MSFSFNPSLWFVCRYCRQIFPNIDKLKKHKLEDHLKECLEIKCIIFEESCISEEWSPPNVILSSKSQSTKPSKGFMNPYVSLTRLTPQDLDSTFRSNNQEIDHQTNTFKRNQNYSVPEGPASCSSIEQEEIKEINKYEIEENFETEQTIKPQQTIQKNHCFEEFDAQVEPKLVPPNATELLTSIDEFEPINGNSFDNNLDLPNIRDSTCASKIQIPTPVLPHIFAKTEPELTTAVISNHEIQPQFKFYVEDYDSSSIILQEENTNGFPNYVDEQTCYFPVIPSISQDLLNTPFMCHICYRCFPAKSRLEIHIKFHSADRPFKCPQCPAAFKQSSDCKRHQIQSHGLETSYKCDWCQKFFQTNKLLVDHERTHTGDRPFKCQVENCNKAFSSSVNLKKHSQAIHFEELGLPQFVCHVCGKSFGTKKRLIDHQKCQKCSF